MEEKNYRELEEEERIKEEMKRNSPKRVTWDDNLQIIFIPGRSQDERRMRWKELNALVSRNRREVRAERRRKKQQLREERRHQENRERTRSESDFGNNIDCVDAPPDVKRRVNLTHNETEEEEDFGSAFVNDDDEDDTNEGYGEKSIVNVEEDTVVVNEKKEKKKKKKKSTSPRRSLRLQTSNLGSAFTETGRRFSLRLKALK